MADPGCALVRSLDATFGARWQRPGQRVFVAVPSRGIDRLPQVLRALDAWLRKRGSRAALVPAMGSHGGGTPEGQLRQLHALGLHPDRLGVEILPPSAYRVVARYWSGEALYLPAELLGSDGLVLVNRVKLHTLFSGPIQSGLAKLLAFGLGGPLGAAASHRQAAEAGLLPTVEEALARLREPAGLLFGIALVEDGAHRLARLEVVHPEALLRTDRRLLRLASSLHPRLPLRQGALLIVEKIGKDMSGSGMDPHVIGRPPGTRDRADFRRIYVRKLSRASHGNAMGIGLADHALRSLWEQQRDPVVTELNARTSGSLDKIHRPRLHATDRDAVWAALSETESGPILQIRDTLHLAEALAVGYRWEQLRDLDLVEVLGPLRFRPDGRLEHLLGEVGRDADARNSRAGTSHGK